MSIKDILMKQSSSSDFWGGPLWRRILIAAIGLALLGAWFFLTDLWFD